MNTPICEFVRNYCEKETLRLHMPGHKGQAVLGMEPYDITEIDGADSLYEASGIIQESEKCAAALFGTGGTFYSAEGSSLCIRAMLYLALLYGQRKGQSRKILAGRNAHKTFVTAAGLLEFEIQWIFPAKGESYLSCSVDLESLETYLERESPTAVYLTTPDYLGNLMDIREVSRICRRYGTLLLVDNAHGAYLKFLPESRHPMDLGADLCCDSAHKTLPVLTGGAYLHVAEGREEWFLQQAKDAMALFGSTSPSYLILQSLDRVNNYIEENYSGKLAAFLNQLEGLKERLIKEGFVLVGQEPLKLTISTKSRGYLGTEFAGELQKAGIVVEFADPDYVVMMLSCEMKEKDLRMLEEAVFGIERKEPLKDMPPEMGVPQRALSVRGALFSERERIPAKESEGRILASLNVGCPPAVPIVVCGERIDKNALHVFEYYQIESCEVVKID